MTAGGDDAFFVRNAGFVVAAEAVECVGQAPPRVPLIVRGTEVGVEHIDDVLPSPLLLVLHGESEMQACIGGIPFEHAEQCSDAVI